MSLLYWPTRHPAPAPKPPDSVAGLVITLSPAQVVAYTDNMPRGTPRDAH